MVAEATDPNQLPCRVNMSSTAQQSSPAPRRAKRDAPMTPVPTAAQEARRVRNELSPVGDDGLPVQPPAKVRLQIPDPVAPPADPTAQFFIQEIANMHNYFKQAIEHVVTFVDSNGASLAEAHKDIALLKQSCRDSPTMIEFTELERGVTNLVTEHAVMHKSVDLMTAQIEAMNTKMGIIDETKKALILLYQANTERIADMEHIKEVDNRFQENVTRDGTGLIAMTKDIDNRPKLLEKNSDRLWRISSASASATPGATSAACGPVTALETALENKHDQLMLEAKIDSIQERVAHLDGVYSHHNLQVEHEVTLVKDTLDKHDGLIAALQADAIGRIRDGHEGQGAHGHSAQPIPSDGSDCPHCIHVKELIMKTARMDPTSRP